MFFGSISLTSKRFSLLQRTKNAIIINGNIKNVKWKSVKKPRDIDDYVRMILTSRVYDVCKETPIQSAKSLSLKLDNKIWLKREDLQPIFSFKIRGAYNKIAHLSEKEKNNGIVCCSAGNHAQGVAMAASELGIDAVIVMPIPTPVIKVNGTRRFGGSTRVLLHGNNYDEAQQEAQRLEKLENRTMIHPYDDPYVIAGQGTIGMEIIKQTTKDPPDAIFCCVGGGGMISGIAAYIKSIRPEIKVFSVEAEDACAMKDSLAKGERVLLDSVGLFADGAAVKRVGEENFRLCQQLVDGAITVNTDDICAAIRNGFNDTRTVMEPAGALALAGLTKYAEGLTQYSDKIENKKLLAVTSGANMNFDRLRFISERAIPNERLFNIRIPEVPGSFITMYEAIAPRNVTEFSYRYSDTKTANIMVSLNIENEEDCSDVLKKLNSNHMEAIDLSHDEVSKTHLRYLVGGQAINVHDEIICRFLFPEVPGCLGDFLGKVGGKYNFSMFHYRNHGSDVGTALVGLQVPEDQQEEFNVFLASIGFPYTVENDNPMYKAFFRH